MAFNGSGSFTLVAGNPVVTGTTISSTWANNTLSDIANGLSTTITKDGQTTPTANIPMGNFKFTGLAAGTAAGNSLRWEQLFSQGTPVTLASAATVDIGGQTSVAVEISGTTTITSFGTNYNGPRFLRFTGALILTHNATTLNLPGGANITTVAGDTAIAYPNAALNGWNVVSLQRGLPSPQATRIDVASVAGTVDLTASAPNTDDIRITGTNAITAFTSAVGRVFRVTAGGAFTLTNNASIVTNTGANISVVAGDTFMLRFTAANVCEVLNYTFVPTSAYSALGADVALSNTALFFDGPSVTLGRGQWYVSAKATFRETVSANASFVLKLWDGTTVIDSANAFTGGAGVPTSSCVAGLISNPAGNVKLSIQDSTNVNGVLMYNNSGLGKDVSITAIRIA